MSSLKIDFVKDVVDATGNKNLLPHNIEKYTQILKDKGATVILILTDLDEDACITLTKKRINPSINHIVIISIKQIEAWFLADEGAMRKFLKDDAYMIQNPETFVNPFDEIRTLGLNSIGRKRGVGTKVQLAKQMVDHANFSILHASKLQQCKLLYQED